MDGGLGAQDGAFGSVSLVVEFHRVAVDAVLDAYALSPRFEVTDHFSGEFVVKRPARSSVSTEKAHDIGAGEGGHGMVDPARIEAS